MVETAGPNPYLGGRADASNAPDAPDASTELSRTELRARVEAGDVVLLDVRPAEEYAAGHIPGARSVPVAELAERIGELPEESEAVRLLTGRGGVRCGSTTGCWSGGWPGCRSLRGSTRGTRS